MAYQTGTATSPTNLLQTLETWLSGRGWTVDSSAVDGSGRRLHVHKVILAGGVGLYVNLRAAMNESIWSVSKGAGYGIGVYAGSGYDGAKTWDEQPGRPTYNNTGGTAKAIGAGMLLGSGSIAAYHFFDDGADNIVVLVEKTPGVYVHLGWGPSMVKHGYTWDAPYFFGSIGHYYNTSIGTYAGLYGGDLTALPPFCHSLYSPSSDYLKPATSFVRVDSSEWAGLWTSNAASGTANEGYTGRYLRNTFDPIGTVSTEIPRYIDLTARAVYTAFPGYMLLPLHTFLYRVATTRYAPLGYPPNLFLTLATTQGVAAGSVVAIGGVNYFAVPYFCVRKV